MWLVCGDRVIASVEVASTPAARRRGLLGRDGIDGAMHLPGIRSVHTIRMRFAIDVVHLDGDGGVLRCTTMVPWRIGGVVRGTRSILEAEAGAFAQWGVAVGDRLEIR